MVVTVFVYESEFGRFLQQNPSDMVTRRRLYLFSLLFSLAFAEGATLPFVSK